jgi:hypothetical protein
MKNKLVKFLIFIFLIIVIPGCNNTNNTENLTKQEDNNSDLVSKEKCYEDILSGFITSEEIIPTEKSLVDIIALDMTNVSYSNVKITDNGLIYVIIKTNDNNIMDI